MTSDRAISEAVAKLAKLTEPASSSVTDILEKMAANQAAFATHLEKLTDEIVRLKAKVGI